MLRCRRCPPATSAPAQPLTSSSADLTRTAYQPSLSLRALASWFAAHGHCADGLLRFGRQALPTSRPSNLEATLQKWQSAALMSVAASNARPQWSPAAMWPGALGCRSWMPVAWYPHCCRRPNLAALEPLELLLIPAALTCTSAAAALARLFIERIIEQHVQAQGAYASRAR